MRRVFLLLAVLALSAAPAAAEPFAIVHPEEPLDSISSEELQRVYLGKKTLWDSGRRITPAILSEDKPVAQQFIEKTLKKTIKQYRAYWKRRLFSGGGAVPKSFSNDRELIEFVSRTPGAIGIVSKRPSSGDVKLVSVSD